MIILHRAERFLDRYFSSLLPPEIFRIFDTIEVDIRKTRDDILVIHHDLSILRHARIGDKISNLKYEEIKEEVITLEEFLKNVANKPIRLIFDIKGYAKNEKTEILVLSLIKKYKLSKKVILSSFYNDVLLRFQQMSSLPLTKVTFLPFLRFMKIHKQLPQRVTLHKKIASQKLLRKLQEKNIEIMIWPIHALEEARYFYQFNVRGYFIDTIHEADLIKHKLPLLYEPLKK